ncbi:hypothetical protein Tco_1302626 [Tanacetum coccineum]
MVEPRWRSEDESGGVDGVCTQRLEEGEADGGGGRSWPESGWIPVTAPEKGNGGGVILRTAEQGTEQVNS